MLLGIVTLVVVGTVMYSPIARLYVLFAILFPLALVSEIWNRWRARRAKARNQSHVFGEGHRATISADKRLAMFKRLIDSGVISGRKPNADVEEEALDSYLWKPGIYASAGRKSIAEGGPACELHRELRAIFEHHGIILDVTESGVRDFDRQVFSWEATVCGEDAVFEAPGVPRWINPPAHPISDKNREPIELPFELVAMSDLLNRVFCERTNRRWFAASSGGAFGHFLVDERQLRLLHEAGIVDYVADPTGLGDHIAAHLEARTDTTS